MVRAATKPPSLSRFCPAGLPKKNPVMRLAVRCQETAMTDAAIVGKPIEIIQTRYTRSVSLGPCDARPASWCRTASFSLPARDRQIKTGMMNDEPLKTTAYLLLVVHRTAVRCRGRDGSPICGEARRLVDPAARKSTPPPGTKKPARLAPVGATHAAGRGARLVASEKYSRPGDVLARADAAHRHAFAATFVDFRIGIHRLGARRAGVARGCGVSGGDPAG